MEAVRTVDCRTCGKRPASDNAAWRCSACERAASTGAVRTPAALFWRSEPVRSAGVRRDFGLVVKAARAA